MFGMPDDNAGTQNQSQNTNGVQPQASLDGAINALASTAPGAPPAPGTTTTPTDTDAGNFMTDDAAQPQPSVPSPAAPSTRPAAATPANAEDGDLLDIKQQALQQLTPLVGHLDQTPEEEFRTTMMMIQAADNQSLVKKAYEAAQKITDEKTRAQALLDIVNEINYFTQHKETPAEQ